jgi:copper oxidase (laccase) domain-containing protein
MSDHFGSRPEDIRVQLAPCIRPPLYEVDFANQIRESCLAAGISPEHYADCGSALRPILAAITRIVLKKVEQGECWRFWGA